MKTADLMDAFGERLQSCTLQFRDYGKVKAFHGSCRTIQCEDDNVLVKQLLGSNGCGSVLVVDGGGSLTSALMGDLLAEMGRRNGWAGVVINGAVRDTVALGTIALGIKALGSNPRKSRKQGTGRIDIPVEFGTVRFALDKWVYCDEDGIVVAEHQLIIDD